MLSFELPSQALGSLVGISVSGTLTLLCLGVGLAYRHFRPLVNLSLFFLGIGVFFLGIVIYRLQVSLPSIMWGYTLILGALGWIPAAWLRTMRSLGAFEARWPERLAAAWGLGITLLLLLVRHPAVLGAPLEYFPPAQAWRPQSWLIRPLVMGGDLAFTVVLMVVLWRRRRKLNLMPVSQNIMLACMAFWLVGALHDTAYALGLPTPLGGLSLWLVSLALALGLVVSLTLELKSADQALRSRESDFARAFHHSPDWMLISTLEDNRILEANHSALQTLGLTRQEVIGRTWTELGVGEDPQQCRRGLDEILHTGSLQGFEIPVRTRRGEHLVLSWSARVIEWEGRPCVLSVAHDISERRRLERELERQRQRLEQKVSERTQQLERANRELQHEIHERRRVETALSQSRSNLELLYDSLQDYILVVDYEGRILETNRQVCRGLGYGEEELWGRSLLDLCPQRLRSQQAQRLKEAARGKEATLRVTFRRKQGGEVPLEIKFTPGWWSDRRVLFGIGRDISERLRAEESLHQLAAGVAHNFNNLLSAILANAQAARSLASRGRLDLSRLRRLLDNVVRSAESGRDVVRRLAAYGGGHQPDPECQVVDLAEVATVSLDIAQVAFRAKGMDAVETVTQLEEGLFVQARRGELMEVLLNLIKNAVEAMPQGGRLEIRAEKHRDRAVVSVKDTGTGMDQETLGRLFQPFFSTKGVAGQGLGLASSRGIVRALGGDITAASQPGQGTVITLWLPLATSPNAGVSRLLPPRPSGTYRLLLVEDEVLVAQGFQAVLEEAGYQVAIADSVAEARRRLESQPWDLVLCDLGLPDGTGWEVADLLERMAAAGTQDQVPLILLTGWGANSPPAPARKVPAAHQLLHKPVDRDRLLETVARALASPRRAAAG